MCLATRYLLYSIVHLLNLSKIALALFLGLQFAIYIVPSNVLCTPFLNFNRVFVGFTSLATFSRSYPSVDDASSVSFGSELHTPMKYQHEPPNPRQDPATPVAWGRSTGNRTQFNIVDNSFSGEADVTARIFSSSSGTADSSVEEVATRRHQQELHQRASRRHHRRNDRDRQRTRPTHADDKMAATVALLKSELQATRSQVEQKEVVTRSLQRQLEQVSLSGR